MASRPPVQTIKFIPVKAQTYSNLQHILCLLLTKWYQFHQCSGTMWASFVPGFQDWVIFFIDIYNKSALPGPEYQPWSWDLYAVWLVFSRILWAGPPGSVRNDGTFYNIYTDSLISIYIYIYIYIYQIHTGLPDVLAYCPQNQYIDNYK